MPAAVIASKRKPLAIIRPKNFGGVIRAVAIRCATTSRTDHPAHSDGWSQASPDSRVSASASEARSVLIAFHVSIAHIMSIREVGSGTISRSCPGVPNVRRRLTRWRRRSDLGLVLLGSPGGTLYLWSQ